jgi:hypothetical protein
MEALESRYVEHLGAIKEAIQNSEILTSYLDEEEDEFYIQLQEYFEPAMQQVFDEVASSNPLQLEALENAFLDPGFEGLFLPKILGYSVLRGEINEVYKYRRPQDHFRKILLTICESANFEMIKKRIGQTVQLGFALSSDIWITNIIAGQTNKRVKAFLNALKLDKFRELHNREALYTKYSKQLDSVNFASTQFPDNELELKASFHSLRSFLLYRSQAGMDNSELMPDITAFITNKDLQSTDELFELLMIFGLSYDMNDKLEKEFKNVFGTYVNNTPAFTTKFFALYEKLHEDVEVYISPEKEQRFSKLVGDIGNKELKTFFAAADEVHSKGFVHVDAIDAVSKYYEKHEGMSLQNECLRATILNYIVKFIDNIEPENYADYMEINKIVIAYISIFNNEKFNQSVKDASMNFVKKCIARFTDKKSRDYQDIKKYVAATYLDLGFLTQKQIVELFKTKRKPVVKS